MNDPVSFKTRAKVADLLLTKRREQKLNQAQLAVKANIAVSTVSNVERGNAVEAETIAILAKTLGCEAEVKALSASEVSDG